jgi:hypothetical protein
MHEPPAPNVATRPGDESAQVPSAWRPFRSATEFGIFAAVSLVPLLFALATNNAWEDWYITYRASKNLALGLGLVFNPGQRVHSFTSPLGALIPAALAYLTGCRSDDLVLWLYRLINSLVLGTSGVLLFRLARACKMGVPATVVMIGILAVDPKTVGFSINGMETAFLVFFIVLCVYALAAAKSRPALLLGVAWAGLMWTRPDGFIYGGAIAAGFWLFPQALGITAGRRELLRWYAAAAIIAGLLYAPWFFWAWSYYGTPVPHTIVAKGLENDSGAAVARAISYPYRLLTNIDRTFLPANAGFGGWGAGRYLRFYQIAVILCALYWLSPWSRSLGRAASFAFLISHFYLVAVVPLAFAWYWPAAATLATVVLGQITEQVVRAAKTLVPGRAQVAVACALPATVLTVHAALLGAAAYQLHWQQALIEEGNRKQIGLWLKEHASSPRDTVLLECLGYIGYFSGLRMYDNPGLSSPEVVASRRRLAPKLRNVRSSVRRMGAVLRDLGPDWAVLRPFEAEAIGRDDAELLSRLYQPVRVFDVSSQVAQVPHLPGRRFLNFDECFIVYHRVVPPSPNRIASLR